MRFIAVEPGSGPSTDLGRGANVLLRVLPKALLAALVPFLRYWSTL